MLRFERAAAELKPLRPALLKGNVAAGNFCMPDTADIVLRTLAVATALVLAGLLLAAARTQRAALPGGLFALAVAAFFLTSTPGTVTTLGVWAWPLLALCVTKAIWFWLFARALFNDGTAIGRHHLVIALTVAVIGTWQQSVFLAHYRAGTAGLWETIAGFGFDAGLLVFLVLGLLEAGRDMAVDLVERRRRLRLGFITVTGAYLLLALGVQTGNLLNGAGTPPMAVRANMAMVIAVFGIATGSLLRLGRCGWLDSARTIRPVALGRAEAAILRQLERALGSERIYLQEGLTIGLLAERLGTSEHLLRRVINQGMGHRNFNDFLHSWRIRDACEALARPEQSRQPVLSIAMQVGYGSLGAFNRAFKIRVGMTPTAYRRRRLNEASLSR